MPPPRSVTRTEMFFLRFVFPETPALHMAVFLFLLAAGVAAMAGSLMSYVESSTFMFQTFGRGYGDSLVMHVIGGTSIVLLALLFEGVLAMLVFCFSVGRIDIFTGDDPDSKRGDMRLFTLLVQVISLWGWYADPYTAHDSLLWPISMYVVVFCIYGIFALRFYPGSVLDARSEDVSVAPIRMSQAVVGIGVAGGAFLYYQSVHHAGALGALCSAYIVFTMLSGLYGAAAQTFFPVKQASYFPNQAI